MTLDSSQFRHNLLVRLIIAGSTILISIPAYYSYQFVRNLTLESLKKNAFLEVGRGVVDIDNWVSKLKTHVETLANTPTIRSMKWPEIEPYLKTEVLRFGDLSSIAIENAQGQEYSLSQNVLKPKSFIYSQPFKPSKANVSDPAVNTMTQEQSISISVQIVNDFEVSSPPIGKIHCLVKLDRASQVIDQIHYGNGSYALALNSDGTIMTHSKLDSAINNDAQNMVKSGNIVQSLDSSLSNIGKKMIDRQRGIELTRIGHNWKYVAYLPLREVNWSIALFIPVENIEAPLRSLDLIALIVAGLVVSVVVGLGKVQAAEQVQLKKLNEELENRVYSRTNELAQALDQLKQSQSQLVQSEKMSGLGQLVAGIAHEINNPITFIHGNIYHLNQYTEQLLFLIDAYKKEHLYPSHQLKSELEETDLDFIKSDLPKILESIQTGTTRVQKIVQSLRTFSRMDEAAKKSVNIHDGIDSTLLILQHQLNKIGDGTKIEVVKEYGNLPMVECYAGQLNQVFMAILVNAIESLESVFMPTFTPKFTPKKSPDLTQLIAPNPSSFSTKQVPPCITIKTYQRSKGKICIEIADNGPGINSRTRQRLFDPFYTTKPIGKGTGLGLSISYQIITQNHQGTLVCESEPGQGAKFIIEIPVVTSVKDASVKDAKEVTIDLSSGI